MKARLEERILARNLREQGWSFSEIMAEIPNLSKGTLNSWLKDVQLTRDQKERLLAKIRLGSDKGRLKGAWKNHQKRTENTERIVKNATDEVGTMIKNPLFMAGVLLYWAEGGKTQERVGFTNSDPTMITLMMKWFRKLCKVNEAKFRIHLSIMALHNKNESEKFWSCLTGVPLTQFNKTHVKPTLLSGKRNPSYMGTCRIIISDKQLFRKIVGWKLGILQNFKMNSLPALKSRVSSSC